jgi:AsmA protein
MKNLRARVAHAASDTRIDPLSFESCGGNLRGSLRRAAGAGASGSARVELDVDAARVSIAELTAALTGTDGGAPATGVLAFELAATGAGDDWPSLRTALDGRGRFDIADGALLGVNVPEAALERITGVPGLAALLPPRLRTDFPGLFGQKDTRFDSLAASFRIADGRLRTQDLAVKAPDFAIDADGTIGLDLGVDLSATLTTSPALSSRLIAEVDTVKLLTNREGIVTIPFRLAGTLPGVKPQPDLPALAARLQRGLVGALGEKLFGGEQKKQPEAPTTP